MNVNPIKESGIAVKPGGISCREYSGETKSVKRIQGLVETVEAVTRVPGSLYSK